MLRITKSMLSVAGLRRTNTVTTTVCGQARLLKITGAHNRKPFSYRCLSGVAPSSDVQPPNVPKKENDKVGVGSVKMTTLSTPDVQAVVPAAAAANPPSSAAATPVKAAKPNMLVSFARSALHVVQNPKESYAALKEGVTHYWLGSKLLWKEIKMATDIVSRVLAGHGMTRRERQQLVRTSGDIFRVFPLAVFILVPFMELLLPFALKMFPNMLPSTFQEKYKVEENMKKEIEMRLQVTGFFTETMQEMAKKRGTDSSKPGGKEISDFIEKARLGEPLPNEAVIRIAANFKDELTLSNIQRPQLVVMCQYMGLAPFGADAFLRFQLRTKLRALKEDDRRILWEGIDSLSVSELMDACQERGMRSLDLSEYAYKQQLKEWLDLSIQKNIPISLLIMSRAFMLRSSKSRFAKKAEDVVKDAMAALDTETINEIVLASTSDKEEKTDSKAVIQRKLESLEFQKVMIEEEREETDEAIAKAKGADKGIKAAKEKEKGDAAAAKDAKDAVTAAAAAAAITEAAQFQPETSPRKVDTSADTETATPVKAVPSESDAVDAGSKFAKSAEADAEDVKVDEEIEEPVAEKEQRAKELSYTEIQALSDLARGSTVEREKSELAKLQARLDAMEYETKQKPAPKPVEEDVEELAEEEAKATDTVAGDVQEVAPTDEFAQTDAASSFAASAKTVEPHKPDTEEDEAAMKQDTPAKPVETSAKEKEESTAAKLLRMAKSSFDEPGFISRVRSGGGAAADTAAGEDRVDQNKKDKDAASIAAAEEAAAAAAEAAAAEEYENKSIKAMQDALHKMVGNLKIKIEDVEEKLLDKFPQLDLDGDGYLSKDELTGALKMIFKNPPTDEEAQKMITDMDLDGDGQISVAELLKFVEARKAKKDVEAFEVAVNTTKAASEEKQKVADAAANSASSAAAEALAAAGAAPGTAPVAAPVVPHSAATKDAL